MELVFAGPQYFHSKLSKSTDSLNFEKVGARSFLTSLIVLKNEFAPPLAKIGEQKAPYQMVQGIDKIKVCGYTEHRKGAAGKRLAPL